MDRRHTAHDRAVVRATEEAGAGAGQGQPPGHVDGVAVSLKAAEQQKPGRRKTHAAEGQGPRTMRSETIPLRGATNSVATGEAAMTSPTLRTSYSSTMLR